MLKSAPVIRTYNYFVEIAGYSIPVFQRILDRTIVEEIAFHIEDQRQKESYPYLGAIEVVNYDGINYIIDGQHRYEAYKLDFERYNQSTLITIIKHYVETYEQMVEIFKLRNMSCEVPKYIIKCENEHERLLMIQIEEFVGIKDGFTKKETRRPFVNLIYFMNRIFHEDILWKFRIETINDFRKLFNEKNRYIENLCEENSFLFSNKISSNMLEKAKRLNLFIGLPQKIEWFYL